MPLKIGDRVIFPSPACARGTVVERIRSADKELWCWKVLWDHPAYQRFWTDKDAELLTIVGFSPLVTRLSFDLYARV